MSEPTKWDEWDTYMWVVAHPDDAEFSSAGTIARLAKMGKRIIIVQVTSGGKGTSDPNVPSTMLASGREIEEKNAANALGAAEVVYLRCTDGELVPDLVLREKVVRQIRTYKPDVVVSHDPFRPYALHPDHRACGFAALDSVYPTARDPHYFPEHLAEGLEPHKTAEIWFFNAEEPDLVVDITGTFDDKINALRRHSSQVGDGTGMVERVRERSAEFAAGQSFELAEAFKTVQMRR